MHDSQDNLIDRFFNMEKTFALFDLKDEDGMPIWDLFRYDIYLHVTFPIVITNKKTILQQIKTFLNSSKLLG